MKKMGLYLRQQRELKGLTQAQVATRLGYGSPQFISNIERGISKVPLSALRSFINLYEISADELIDLILEDKKDQLRKYLNSHES